MPKYFTAIIICTPQPVTGNKALKYRNIPQEGAKLDQFIRFAGRFPGALHINFYDKETRDFVQQIPLVQKTK